MLDRHLQFLEMHDSDIVTISKGEKILNKDVALEKTG